MAPILRVSFSGLHAFFPDSPFFLANDTPGSPKAVTVIVPNAIRPRLATASAGVVERSRVYRGSHLPAMLFDMGDVAVESLENLDTIISSPVSGQSIGVKVLSRERIKFDFTPVTDGLVCDLARGIEKSPQPSDERSLWWVPRMMAIAPDLATIKADPDDFKLMEEMDAAAILEFSHGRLSVTEFNRDQSDKVREWNFGRVAWDGRKYEVVGPLSWQRAIGNEVLLEVPMSVSGGSSVVEVQFETSANEEAKKITLSSPVSSEQIGIRIVNMETESVTAFVGAFPVTNTSLVTTFGDPDFERYYQLHHSGVETGLLPIVDLDVVGPDARPCAPALFEKLERTQARM